MGFKDGRSRNINAFIAITITTTTTTATTTTASTASTTIAITATITLARLSEERSAALRTVMDTDSPDLQSISRMPASKVPGFLFAIALI